MNIFFLHGDTKKCAEMHCDKHVVKMIIEYAQLLSTAHRMLDGQEYIDKTSNGRNIRRWRMPGELDTVLMKASHINHPSAVWARQSSDHYLWLYHLWFDLCQEYTHRYGKTHSCYDRLKSALYVVPKNIPFKGLTQPPPAMPDDCKIAGDSIASYRKYYIERKNHFAKWKNREVPVWYSEGLNKNNANLQLS
jgi:hypothetical protein